MKSQTLSVYPKTFSGLLDDIFGEQGSINKIKDEILESMPKRNVPPVNIVEKKDGYEIQLLVPGIAKEDMQIEVKENVLEVSYNLPAATSEESVIKVIKKEFSKGSFKRTFSLNELLDIEKISAVFENGILVINVPKKEETVKLHKVISIS